MSDDPDRFAPEGTVWVCRACGRSTRPDLYRFSDESCVLNAVLCHEKKPGEDHFRAVQK